jgi:uncharacterized membrane protein YeaQ/YmgE (transglycosylase-associated protein family)
MGILAWIVLGLLAGALARFILPGSDSMGWIMTILVGIVGAFIGGYVATLVGFGSVTGFNLTSLLTATGGAILLLVVVRIIKK